MTKNWTDPAALERTMDCAAQIDALLPRLHAALARPDPDPALCRALFDALAAAAARGEEAASWGHG